MRRCICTACVYLSLFLQGASAQQNNERLKAKRPASSPAKAVRAALPCHSLLVPLANNDRAYFDEKSDEELTELSDLLDGCVREHYWELTKPDLAVAAIVLGWVHDISHEREYTALSKAMLKMDSDRTELQKKYDGLVALLSRAA